MDYTQTEGRTPTDNITTPIADYTAFSTIG